MNVKLVLGAVLLLAALVFSVQDRRNASESNEWS